ncbi:hypothetical protein BGZ76_006945 [Entomortierella beljakovae]|nr:hypothetical protein BGZ76_006945 [Entomortierella beljakovae]
MGPFQVSESIFLTPVWETDMQELYRILNINKDVANGVCSPKMVFPFPMENAVSFVERHKNNRLNNEDITSWAIRQSVDGPIIGVVGLDKMEHGGLGLCYKEQSDDDTQKEQELMSCCSIGYWISPEYSGKGIMTRVVMYAADHLAPKELGYGRVHAEAFEENKASQKVMQKAGMSPTRGIPRSIPKFNSMRNMAHYIKDVK